MIFLREGFIFDVANHSTDMSSGEKALNAIARRGKYGFNCGWDEYMRNQNREIVDTTLFGLKNSHCIRGSRRLKADGEEHHLLSRVVLSDFDSIQRRVDHTYITACRLCRKQIAV